MQCRSKGYIHDLGEPNRPMQEAAEKENEHSSLENIEEKQFELVENEPTLEKEALRNDEQAGAFKLDEPKQQRDVIPFGDHDENADRVISQMRMSRKGCVKASPYKISRCLHRMEQLEKEQGLSQRVIATQVASEYSTK